MIVKDAKEAARQWVVDEASHLPGFFGAFYAGSVNELDDGAYLPGASDIDVWVVFDRHDVPVKPGKVVYRGLLLDVSYAPSEQFQPAEADVILGDYHRAPSFRTPSVILDPSGRLSELQRAVSKYYAKRRWVRARCEHARSHALQYIRSFDDSAALHDQVATWLFGAGVTTHVLLAAGLKNPTVRRRYAAARELLAAYGHAAFYEELLDALGCTGMGQADGQRHLDALTEVFDAASAVVTTPFVFASDISEAARPIAIGGSQELIESGLHREAIFWIAATYARCQKILITDAPPEMREAFTPGFRHLLAELGITSLVDLRRRNAETEMRLSRVWEVAEAIMAANPEIEG